MTQSEFYAARVTECQTVAAASSLVNVRDRSLRAAAAWQVLLDREDHLVEVRAHAIKGGTI